MVSSDGRLNITAGGLCCHSCADGRGSPVLAEIGRSDFKTGHFHAEVNGVGGWQTYISTVPGRPPALVPQDGLSLPPTSWGCFFQIAVTKLCVLRHSVHS